MSDKIIRAVAKDGMIRIIAGTTTNLVEYAREIHECTQKHLVCFPYDVKQGEKN